jgi:hypothetical protein
VQSIFVWKAKILMTLGKNPHWRLIAISNHFIQLQITYHLNFNI